jgi:hypothetical protein
MYGLIGKATVRFALRYARKHYGRQGKIALGVAVAAAGVAAAYLASREVPEG